MGLGDLCPETLTALKSTLPALTLDNKKKLHPEGELEMIALGERFQMRFPDLLNNYQDPLAYKFRSTVLQRAQQSQFHFAIGLFERPIAQKIQYETPITPHDPLLRFYKICDRWLNEVKLNPESLREFNLFQDSEFFSQNVIQPLSTRLGYQRSLTKKEVEEFYLACQFGQAWQPRRPSPWCSIFEPNELEILEYREDLEYYWIDGYGKDINHKPACVLFKDLLENFSNLTKGVDSEERAIFYFSHAGLLMKFLCFLGLNQDAEPLLHNNFEAMKQRQYRTSQNVPFGANVAFVIQECSNENNYKVGMFLNEKLTQIPGCNQEWCDYSTFVDLHREEMSRCDFSAICDLETGEKASSHLRDRASDDRF
eukprot:TCALIF_01919-PA protein Name:"Similar to MINPP1 Multiple inositol polyphosphate phosphatase 1 (Homo sapiens)" AED:0.37 eAED:0.38 QI:0/0/0/1/0/0/2/0/367